ncbi:MAG TPA: hypothetical protein VGZ47_08950 [Gemmataceae bacterium]|jgi:hypothetical protein|nr:hypothetical protein [Gemmataceae bacterium]
MSDKLQTPVLDRPEDPARYQPLSLLAVAAILTATLFTVFILLFTVAGLYSRKPVLEPVLILVAVGGVILALAARWHIANSEGTRAGTKLTKVALWMCLICGLCYGAYFGGNYFAIRKQASDNAQKYWFEPLKEGKVDEAFFYTIDPVQRKNSSVRDVSNRFGDSVERFHQQELVLILDRARQEAQIEPRGVRNWSKETAGYVVSLNYLIRTREGEFEAVITLIGADNKELAGREWYVQKGRDLVQVRRPTTFGRMVTELQLDADRFMREWIMMKAMPGREEERYLDTVPVSPEQRRQRLRDDSVWMALRRSMACGPQPSCGLSQALALAEFFGADPVDRSLYFPVGTALAKQIVIAEKTKDAQSDEYKEQMLSQLFQSAGMSLPRSLRDSEVPTSLELTPQEIRVSLPVMFQMPMPKPVQFKGRVFVSTKEPALLKKIQELQSAPWLAPVVMDTSPGSVLAGMQPNWHISEVRVDFTPQMDPRMEKMLNRPGGPGGPDLGPGP